MRISFLAQLGFDFDTPGDTVESDDSRATNSPSPVAATPAAGPPQSAPTVPMLWTEFAQNGAEPRPNDIVREKPSRGRAATRARTAVLFSRLQAFGLRGIEGLVLMRTRTVMVSISGRTLRVHEGYADAPEPVMRAIVTFATARTRLARTAAKETILAHNVEREPPSRRIEPARPGDLAILAQLRESHRALNAQWFDGALTALPIRLSGKMATRLGHFDPGSRHLPSEIVLSRTHVVKHGWRETMHTLLHEMVHQWQHETGAALDHGPGFRAKCVEVGITPAARRYVLPINKRRRAAG